VKQPDSSGSSSSSSPVLPRQQEQQQQQVEDGGQQAEDGYFRQVYWVCDAAWPTDAQEQVRPASNSKD
jgi:hypothetical protein